jgi:hypothetical protein
MPARAIAAPFGTQSLLSYGSSRGAGITIFDLRAAKEGIDIEQIAAVFD